jgi:hypothetical protein
MSSFTTRKTELASLASCPPPAGVVVVISDPPAGRGQLAARLKLEEVSPAKIQLLNRPRKQVTPKVHVEGRGDPDTLRVVIQCPCR